MFLRFYQDAETVKKLALTRSQYVKVVRGIKQGSIAKIVDVKHINFTNNNFYLEIEGHRKFWMKGSNLDHLPDYEGETLWKITTDPEILDMMGRIIKVGCVLVFFKNIMPGVTSVHELVIATVRAIRPNGSIIVKLIRTSNNQVKCPENFVLKARCKCLIIDRNLGDELMLYKLAN